MLTRREPVQLMAELTLIILDLAAGGHAKLIGTERVRRPNHLLQLGVDLALFVLTWRGRCLTAAQKGQSRPPPATVHSQSVVLVGAQKDRTMSA